MRKFLLTTATALSLAVIPTAAFASRPTHPTHNGTTTTTTNTHKPTTTTTNTHKPTTTRKVPVVMYVLRGSLSAYSAASGAANGSVSITVSGSNQEPKTLKGLTLVFATDAKTKVELFDDKAIANGDRGIVKVRAAKNLDAVTLQTEVAFQVIDQGVAKTADSTTTTIKPKH